MMKGSLPDPSRPFAREVYAVLAYDFENRLVAKHSVEGGQVLGAVCDLMGLPDVHSLLTVEPAEYALDMLPGNVDKDWRRYYLRDYNAFSPVTLAGEVVGFVIGRADGT